MDDYREADRVAEKPIEGGLDCAQELGHPDGPPPVVEGIEDVRLAELDAHRASPRAFRVITLAVPIDAAEGDGQRHALRRPPRHPLEHRSGDPDQVALILP